MLNIAMVGCGNISSYHVNAIAAAPLPRRVTITALVDPDPERTAKLSALIAEKLGGDPPKVCCATTTRFFLTDCFSVFQAPVPLSYLALGAVAACLDRCSAAWTLRWRQIRTAPCSARATSWSRAGRRRSMEIYTNTSAWR